MARIYPFVPSGSSIHLTPEGAVLFSGAGRRSLDGIVVDVLRRCDGTKRMDEIVAAVAPTAEDQLEVLANLPHLVAEGGIAFSRDPVPTSVRVTGSTQVYFPTHLTIELTESCNLKCGHCYRDSSPGKVRHMAPRDLLRCLAAMEAVGLRSVELTGGEPLLYREFDRLLEYCCDTFAIVGLLTNGTMVTQAKAEFLGRFKDRMVVSVSLDGACPETHDARRGRRGAFARTVPAIERLAREGIKVRVAMCFDDTNQDEVAPTLRLARSLGAFRFGCAPVMPFGRGRSSASAGPNREAARPIEFAPGDLDFLTVTSALDQEELAESNCGAGYRTFTMDPWGDIRPCASFPAGEFSLGNVLRDPLDVVFGNPLVRAFAQVRAPTEALCGACPEIAFCKYCTLRGLERQRESARCAWKAQGPVSTIVDDPVAGGRWRSEEWLSRHVRSEYSTHVAPAREPCCVTTSDPCTSSGDRPDPCGDSF